MQGVNLIAVYDCVRRRKSASARRLILIALKFSSLSQALAFSA